MVYEYQPLTLFNYYVSNKVIIISLNCNYKEETCNIETTQRGLTLLCEEWMIIAKNALSIPESSKLATLAKA